MYDAAVPYILLVIVNILLIHLIEINLLSSKKMHLKMSSAKRWPYCFSLNVLKYTQGI